MKLTAYKIRVSFYFFSYKNDFIISRYDIFRNSPPLSSPIAALRLQNISYRTPSTSTDGSAPQKSVPADAGDIHHESTLSRRHDRSAILQTGSYNMTPDKINFCTVFFL
jgi:hypothetical protein